MKSWRKRKPEKLFRGDKKDLFQKYLDSIDPMRQMRGNSSRDPYSKVIRRLKKVSQESTFFNISAADAPPEVKILLMQGIDAVIHGHTHSAKAYGIDSGLYLNSGTWGQLLPLPSSGNIETWREFLNSLEKHSFVAEAHPTFVRVRQAPDNDGTALASLCLWQGEPVTWSQWRFEPKGKVWGEVYRAPEAQLVFDSQKK
jgi:hypothetical protein